MMKSLINSPCPFILINPCQDNLQFDLKFKLQSIW